MNPAFNTYAFAADFILLMHFAFVAFVVFGFAFIWIGHFFKFKCLQNATFRICHMLSMGIVLCESLIGAICPLTVWENNLRLKGGQSQIYETSFVKDWVHKIMFFDFSEQTFIIMYGCFFVLILLTFWIIPPKIDSKAMYFPYITHTESLKERKGKSSSTEISPRQRLAGKGSRGF